MISLKYLDLISFVTKLTRNLKYLKYFIIKKTSKINYNYGKLKTKNKFQTQKKFSWIIQMRETCLKLYQHRFKNNS